jgi:hypothetical protein
MSELDDLVAVFGRVDDAVVADPSLEPRVAAMLPPYRQGAGGWYRALRDWQRRDGSVQLADLQGIGPALESLQGVSRPPEDGHESWATRHWLDGRRMLASATLSRIPGSIALPSGADPSALVQGIAAPGGEEQLHGHLGRARQYPNIEAWPKMMGDALAGDMFDRTYENSAYVPPISWAEGSFRVVSSQIKGTSVALRVHHHLTDLDLPLAKSCLDPRIWSSYRPPWCAMTALRGAPSGMNRYVEVVSANCGLDPKLTTVLDFRRQDLADGGGILEYRIPDGLRVPQADGCVAIDEGSIEIRPARAPAVGIHCVSTKRIQFQALQQMPTMTAAGLAFLVWVLGWDTLAERFIYFCARAAATGPPSLVPPDPSAAAPQDLSFLQGSPSDGGIATILNLGISGWENYLRGCVGPVRSSAQLAASGNYGLVDYLSDLTKVSNEVTKNSTALASLGAQMWRAVSGPGGSQQGGGTGTQPGQPTGPQPGKTGPAMAPAKKAAARKATAKRAPAKKAAARKATAKRAPAKKAAARKATAKRAPAKKAAARKAAVAKRVRR